MRKGLPKVMRDSFSLHGLPTSPRPPSGGTGKHAVYPRSPLYSGARVDTTGGMTGLLAIFPCSSLDQAWVPEGNLAGFFWVHF